MTPFRIGRSKNFAWRIFGTGRAAICVLAAALILVPSPNLRAAEGGAGLSATGKVDEAVSPEMRAYLQLQEQLRAMQLAVERNRKESTETALQTAEALAGGMKATSETLANRMKVLEESMSTQRSRELDAMQSSNKTMLIVACVFASFGFLALFMMGYFQWRTVSRLAEISAVLPRPGFSLAGQRPRGALIAGESSVSAPALGHREDADLFQTIAQLEKRIRELEHGSATHNGNGGQIGSEPPNSKLQTPNQETKLEGPDSKTQGPNADGGSDKEAMATNPDGSDRVTVLLGKGQSLLNVEKAEEALACFEEVLALDGRNAEALVKKGAALERLRKLNEAIECYDRAIEADSTMTIAYLYKGGLCNRLERFNEALQCYEQALRTQEKRAA